MESYEKMREYHKKYREIHKDKIKEYQHKYWAEHGEEINAKRKNRKSYKFRCEKAIELVKENLMGMGYMEVDKLLNILEESDKNVK